MRSTSQAHADAHESVTVNDSSDLQLSQLAVDGMAALYIHGTEGQRADFLRRLAAVAAHAADELVPRIQADSVPSVMAVSA